jgi:hypothetical protein
MIDGDTGQGDLYRFRPSGEVIPYVLLGDLYCLVSSSKGPWQGSREDDYRVLLVYGCVCRSRVLALV